MRLTQMAVATVAAGFLASTTAVAEEGKMMITRTGSQPSRPGSAENFTGTVAVEMLFPVQEPSRVSAAAVTFEPGARTAWHSHPAGQTLVVTAGTGWIQQEGGAKKVITVGDVAWTPPGAKHWHGATPTERMTHIAMLETVNGTLVHWMEKVSDEQYQK